MRKRLFLPLAMAAALLLSSAMPAGEAVTKEGQTTVVNTTTLCADVRGFKGPTPVKIYIEKGKVTRIETLPCKETPKYYAKAKTLLAQYEGKSVAKAQKARVDAVTGATYSSKALIQNVQTGLAHYKKQR